MEDSKEILEYGLLQPLPPEVEAELYKILDAEIMDLATRKITPNPNYKKRFVSNTCDAISDAVVFNR